MSMTREEAIERYEGIRYTVACFTGSKKDCDAVDMAFSALRPVSRERVEKVWRGEWKHYLPPLGAGDVQCRCTRCGRTPDVETPFCAWCGSPMTDEAVDILRQRIKEAVDGETD